MQPRLLPDYAATATRSERAAVRRVWTAAQGSLLDALDATPAACPVCASTTHTERHCPHGTAPTLDLDHPNQETTTMTDHNAHHAAACRCGTCRALADALDASPTAQRPRRLPWPTVAVSTMSAAPVTAAAVDATIARYLPASIAALRSIIEDRTGEQCTAHTVTECLVILADFDHNVDASPLRAY